MARHIKLKDYKHSIIGASSLERTWNCPGWLKLKGDKPNKSTIYTATGTAAHHVASTYLQEGWWFDIGDVIENGGFQVKVDQKMLKAVKAYTDLVEEMIREYKLDIKKHVFIEQDVKLIGTDLDGEPRVGTADCILVVPYKKLTVIDYKNGSGHKVDADDNYQLRDYALGALRALDQRGLDDINLVEIIIVQPNALGGGIEKVYFDREELEEFEIGLHQAIARVQPKHPDSDVTNAGKWCTFCPAELECPTNRQKLKDVDLDFEVDVMPQLPAISKMTPELAGRILAVEKAAKSFFEKTKEWALEQALAGVEIPGQKLVAKRSNREWDEDKAVDFAIMSICNLSEDDICKHELLSPSAMEKMLKEHNKTFDLTPYITKPDNGYTLAPIDDKRSVKAIDTKDVGDTIDI